MTDPVERTYALTRIAKARIEAGQNEAALHPIERAIGLAKTVREPERRLEAVLEISGLQAEKLQDARGALATVALLDDAGARDRATAWVVKAPLRALSHVAVAEVLGQVDRR